MNDVRNKLLQAKDLMEQDRWAQARTVLLEAVRKAPTDQNALVLTRFCLTRLGEKTQALYYAQKAAEHYPTNPDILTNLGQSLISNGKSDEAVVILERVLESAPAHPHARVALCSTLIDRVRHVEALRQAQEGMVHHPGHPDLARIAAQALISLGRCDEAAHEIRPVVLANPTNVNLLQLQAAAHIYAASVTPEDVSAAHLAHGRMLERLMPASTEPFKNDRDPERPIRVGLVAGDFRRHASYYFLTGLLERYDRERVQLVLYHNYAEQDAHTARLRAMVERGVNDRWETFRDISRMQHHEAAALIRRDGVDVALDLAGITLGSALPMFCHRVAPVQATWLGYPCTTGVRQMDYRMTDAVIDPAGTESFSSEELLRIDPCWACWRAPEDAGEVNPVPPSQRSAGEPITFASFTALQKFNEPMIRAWCRVLREVPNSRLLIKNNRLVSEQVREVTARRFELAGLARERLVMEGPNTSGSTIIDEYSRVDIVLDSWPYNGYTTTLEAAWMGVPTVTRVWGTPPGRFGLLVNRQIGLEDLAAYDDEGFVSLAVGLARDADRLRSLRSALRERVRTSGHGDADVYCRGFEAAMRTVWRRWCEGGRGGPAAR